MLLVLQSHAGLGGQSLSDLSELRSLHKAYFLMLGLTVWERRLLDVEPA